MGISDYDTLHGPAAEGRASETLRQRAALAHDARTPLPLFHRYVILDTIFDPTIVNAKKLDYWEHELGVSNIKYAVAAPRNAIIASPVISNNTPPGAPTMVLYPFFPPTLSLPCKPGEHVWVIFEDPAGTRNDLGYWMCRIVQPGLAEDVNHTHPHRAQDSSFTPGTQDTFEETDDPIYEFRNGVVGKLDDERYTIAETSTMSGGDDAYKKLMTESDGGRLAHYEPVPRYRKRPGDTVFEGTNNTLIVLGRDRSGPIATYEDSDDKGLIPSITDGDSELDGAGMIDLVVGRGQTDVTGGTPVDNDLPAKEIGKSPKELSEFEGDPDFANDRSRVLIAQRTRVDGNFGLNDFNEVFSVGSIQGGPSGSHIDITDDPEADPAGDETEGDGAVVIKSDKVRLIARADVEILVTSFTRTNGNLETNLDTSTWAALVIKANGDIVLRPAEAGYIKLGGDDADKGLVCSDVSVSAEDGIITGPPMITTMGGQFAGAVRDGNTNKPALASTQAKYASKVLVK